MNEDILSLDDFIGMQMIYVYENGWEYEIYIKNERTIDYRIHTGRVGGRWVREQEVDVVMLMPGVFKVAWTEPTGTDVSLDFMPNDNKTHGQIFFPKWVHDHPEITVCYQNDYIDLMHESREKYETYPKDLVSEFSKIIFKRQRGKDNEKVVDVAPYAGMIKDIQAGLL